MYIDTDVVREWSSQIRVIETVVERTKRAIERIRSDMDISIRNRAYVDEDILELESKIDQMREDMIKLSSFLEYASSVYEQCEEKLLRLAKKTTGEIPDNEAMFHPLVTPIRNEWEELKTQVWSKLKSDAAMLASFQNEYDKEMFVYFSAGNYIKAFQVDPNSLSPQYQAYLLDAINQLCINDERASLELINGILYEDKDHFKCSYDTKKLAYGGQYIELLYGYTWNKHDRYRNMFFNLGANNDVCMTLLGGVSKEKGSELLYNMERTLQEQYQDIEACLGHWRVLYDMYDASKLPQVKPSDQYNGLITGDICMQIDIEKTLAKRKEKEVALNIQEEDLLIFEYRNMNTGKEITLAESNLTNFTVDYEFVDNIDGAELDNDIRIGKLKDLNEKKSRVYGECMSDFLFNITLDVLKIDVLNSVAFDSISDAGKYVEKPGDLIAGYMGDMMSLEGKDIPEKVDGLNDLYIEATSDNVKDTNTIREIVGFITGAKLEENKIDSQIIQLENEAKLSNFGRAQKYTISTDAYNKEKIYEEYVTLDVSDPLILKNMGTIKQDGLAKFLDVEAVDLYEKTSLFIDYDTRIKKEQKEEYKQIAKQLIYGGFDMLHTEENIQLNRVLSKVNDNVKDKFSSIYKVIKGVQ